MDPLSSVPTTWGGGWTQGQVGNVDGTGRWGRRGKRQETKIGQDPGKNRCWECSSELIGYRACCGQTGAEPPPHAPRLHVLTSPAHSFPSVPMTSRGRQAYPHSLRSLEGGGHSGVHDNSAMRPKAQPEHLTVHPWCGVSVLQRPQSFVCVGGISPPRPPPTPLLWVSWPFMRVGGIFWSPLVLSFIHPVERTAHPHSADEKAEA